MPELPEVETTRLGLLEALEGRTIRSASVTHPRLLRRQARHVDFADRLEGRVVTRLGRRGKFLMFDVEGDFTWITHLGMSGRISVDRPDDEVAPHTHVVVDTDAGAQVRMVDPRTFGFTVVYTPAELEESTIGALGPDAWTDLPRAPQLLEAATRRRVMIKTLLLDQTYLAGLGNIYADEVLHRAKVAPQRRSDSITADEMKRIRAAIRPVLKDGLRYGGTSLDDLAYLLPDGRAGEYLDRLRVYGRDGRACRRCGSIIERQVIGGRSSHFCPNCQG